MKLNDIVANSNYVTDEQIEDSNIVGIANTAIAEVNSKCSTALPFFTEENVSTANYWVVTPSWCLRLIEPYISYSIAANDGDSNTRDFHYNRFLQAIAEFKENGLDDIATKDPTTGEETNFAGGSANMVKVNVSDVTLHWGGWI